MGGRKNREEGRRQGGRREESLQQYILTGCPMVTTPISLTMLGCLNCPLMAAS